jgi:lipid A 4'-phosphatase
MRNKSILTDFVVALTLLVGATLLISATGADLAAERHFFLAAPNWAAGDADPWRSLYRFGVWPSYLLAGCALLLLVAGCFWAKAYPLRKHALFLVLLMALGPGLLVNAVFKDHWGRPRPRQMQAFGGDRSFHEVWERGIDGAGRSFPSGHASAAFYLMAPYFVLRARDRRRARLALAAGIGYGVVMGYARMAQGGHFPSDVLWAGGVVYLVGLSLYYLLRLDQPEPCAPKEPCAP